MDEEDPIVLVRNLEFTYENGTKALSNVNLSIKKGSILALLGPSASGKTTLLSSIVGVLQPSSGQVIRNYESLGFMPQSYCLHDYFTTREILYFYARLYGIDHPDSAIKALLDTFELPSNRTIQDCSGGMKRRISLCCAILHSPELVILDEPTVGVDPLLRKKIWDYILELSANSAVIVSTHYTEEAALAHQFVFLRKGRILDCGDVSNLCNLKNKYFDKCLEDRRRSLSLLQSEEGPASKLAHLKNILTPPRLTFLDDNPIRSPGDLKSMIYKNIIVLKRHRAFMLFQAFLPLITLIIFGFSIGGSLKDIRITVLNEDQRACNEGVSTEFHCPSLLSVMRGDFDFMSNMSCKILHRLHHESSLKLEYSESSLSEARRRIIDGDSVAIIHFPQGFSNNLVLKLQNSINPPGTQSDQHNSSIGIILDSSNKLMTDQIHASLYHILERTLDNFLKVCQVPLQPSTLLMSIDLHAEVQRAEMDLTMGMLPVMMSAVLYFMAFALTGDLTASEKEAGLLVRLTLAGVRFKSILTSQLLVQSSVVFFQILLCLILLKSFVCPECSNAILILVAFLFSLQSLSGMTIGIFLSTLASSREQVIQYGLAIIFPTFLLCGLLWPLVSLPLPLKILSYSLPVTLPGQFIQRLIHRQVIDDYAYLGLSIIIPLIWSGASIFCTLFVAKRSGSLYKL